MGEVNNIALSANIDPRIQQKRIGKKRMHTEQEKTQHIKMKRLNIAVRKLTQTFLLNN